MFCGAGMTQLAQISLWRGLEQGCAKTSLMNALSNLLTTLCTPDPGSEPCHLFGSPYLKQWVVIKGSLWEVLEFLKCPQNRGETSLGGREANRKRSRFLRR